MHVDRLVTITDAMVLIAATALDHGLGCVVVYDRDLDRRRGIACAGFCTGHPLAWPTVWPLR